MIRIGLILFPGSNCERETALAVRRVGMEAVEFLWNEPLEKLASFDGYILIGGFSYEDRSRAGIIAALQSVMHEIKRQGAKGKPILGICNGAQILLESGMLQDASEAPMALTENKRVAGDQILGTGYYNAWVNMRLATHVKENAFTRLFTSEARMHLPVAHAEGRFVMPQELLDKLNAEGRIIFQYCDEDGKIDAHFPINPNGSLNNIAAIANKKGNVLAMMPHPERTTNGDILFASMRDFIKEKEDLREETVSASSTFPKPLTPPVFSKKATSTEFLIKLIITDNHALTVQKTLRELGFPVTVQRFVHWEILGATENELIEVEKSEVLYCPRKERRVVLNHENSSAYLVRSKEDIIGQRTLQTLKNHFSLPLEQVIHGIVWQFFHDNGDIKAIIDDILNTNIIRSMCAHDCYQYS